MPVRSLRGERCAEEEEGSDDNSYVSTPIENVETALETVTRKRRHPFSLTTAPNKRPNNEDAQREEEGNEMKLEISRL